MNDVIFSTFFLHHIKLFYKQISTFEIPNTEIKPLRNGFV